MNWLAIAIHLADSDERPLLIVDNAARVRIFNVACERLLGWRREDVVDRPVDELVDAGSRACVVSAVGTAMHGLAGRCKVRMPSADGTLVDGDLVLQPAGIGVDRERAVLGIVESAIASGRWTEIVADGPGFGAITGREGERCYEREAGRTAPCEGCPVPAVVGASATNVLVLENGHVMIARAHRTSAGLARVEHEHFPASMAPRLARERLSSLARRHGLSEREREVLDLLVRGQSVEDIGRALGIAPRTAKFHQANVLGKLGVGSRVELIRLLVTEE